MNMLKRVWILTPLTCGSRKKRLTIKFINGGEI